MQCSVIAAYQHFRCDAV